MAADYHYGGTEEESNEIRKLKADVAEDTDNFENWEKLVRAAESLEGGLNRNSSPQAISTVRDAYDRFLLKFPLLFGYWKKYADLEFSIAGTEAAEMVFERGVASITNSVDLWTDYCSFKVETSHDPDVIRELFERGAAAVGLDFLAHPFWDKYLEFEDRLEAQDRIFVILGRIVHIPMHQYARYFEKFRQLAHTRPLNELLPTETLAQYRDEVQAASTNYPVPPKSDLEVEREIRAKVDSDHMRVFTRTQTETTKRWTYESEIKRPYFHVTELEVHQLVNWRKYLDFEEAEGDYSRVQFLYERCLVTCAFYDEFWFRYARWMHAQEGREEEVRNIYQRASTLFVPISKPGIRLQYAYFEESTGRTEVAQDIHEAILLRLPGHVETIVSWANLQRRQSGLEAAAKVYNDQLGEPLVGLQSRAALVVELACLHWKYDGSAAKARQIFQDHMQSYADSLFFWEKYLLFEIEQPTSAATETEQYAKISGVFDSIRELGNLSLHSVRELSHYYLEYLLNRGSKTAMKEFLRIDRDINGPASVQATKKSGKSAMAIVIDEEQQRHDEEQQRQGEVRYGKYFQIPELIEDAQNPTQLASFN